MVAASLLSGVLSLASMLLLLLLSGVEARDEHCD